MIRSGLAAAAALGLALGATGCAHSLAGAPASVAEPRVAALGSFAVRAEALLAQPERGVDLAALLEARLRARGAAEVVRTDEPAAGRARIDLYLVGTRATPLTRWTVFPWGLVFLGTVGVVPHRGAWEHVVEVHATLPDAPPGARIRVTRRSYVAVTWTWLPLAFAQAAPGERSAAELRRVHAEGLARAIDAALDEVLAPPAPAAAPRTSAAAPATAPGP